jgi:hypothetical protein
VVCGGSPCRLLGQDDLARSAPKVPTSTSMEPDNAVIVLPFVVFTLFHSLNKDIMGVAGVITDFAQIMSGTYLLTYLGICHHVHTPAEHHTHPNHVHFSDHQIHIELTRISGSQSSWKVQVRRSVETFVFRDITTQCRTGICLKTKQDGEVNKSKSKEFVTTFVDCIVSMSVHVTFIYLFQYWRKKVMASHIQYAGAN